MSAPQLKQYDSHKDSGVPWLGVIPADWSVIRLKDVGKSVIGLTYAPEDVLDDDTGTLVLRSSNIQQGQLSLLDNVYVAKKIPRNLTLRIGDILICSRNGSRNLIGKNITIDDRTVGQTFGAFMTVYRSKYSNFLRYFFNSQIFESQSGLFMSSTINQLTSNTLSNFSFVLPTTDEQTSIATYLDTKTAKIDSQIDLLGKKATQYGKLKQSLINEAVTRGLDKSAPMKDSGVVWIGEVPEHWEVRRGKDIFEQTKNKAGLDSSSYDVLSLTLNGVIKRDLDNMKGKIPASFDGYQIASPGDLVLCLFDIDVTPRIVGYVNNLGIITSAYTVIKGKRNVDMKYFLYYYLEQNRNGSLLANSKTLRSTMTFDLFSQLLLPVPPLREQRAIASYLDKKTAQIDRIITAINTQTDKLKDLRKALINDVVTGKIKVVSEGFAV
jgi:type I restriction enzyme S subunit